MAHDAPDDENNKILFNPPLYIQRYNEVLRICSEMKPKKVADFGCAECKLINLLKRESYIEELYGVDINKPLLDASCNKVEPFSMDFVNPRSNPLLIKLFQGSVLEHDLRLNDLDMISCIEIIEHLAVEDVPAFTQNLFSHLKPKQVIISTPNADFNVLFKFKPTQLFRHWDHKFEWTKFEFQTWCNNVCKDYDYNVHYIGIGRPPYHEKDLGYCTQMALFTTQSVIDETIRNNGKEIYEVVAECSYPFKSEKDKLKDDIVFTFNKAVDSVVEKCSQLLEDVDMERNMWEINTNNYHRNHPKNGIKKSCFYPVPGQFEDIDGNAIKCDEYNIYNQQKHPVKALPLHDTYTFASRLKDWYLDSKFESVEREQFSDNIATSFNECYNVYDINLDHANYKLLHYTVGENHDFEKFTDLETIYCNKRKFKLPISCVMEQTVLKDLQADKEMIFNCLRDKMNDSITLTSDLNFVEVEKCQGNDSTSSDSSKFSNEISQSSLSYFHEDYWD